MTLTQSLEHRLRRVSVEQRQVLLQHLGKRPVRDALPVGEAAARTLGRLRLLHGEPGPELPHEPCLADSRVAHDRDQVRLAAIDRVAVARPQELQLPLPADEGGSQPTHAAGAHEGEGADETPAGDAVGLSLGLDGARLVELEGASHDGNSPLADEDLPGSGSLLEPGADVDRIAGHERAALARAADDDLAGVNADPECELVAE